MADKAVSSQPQQTSSIAAFVFNNPFKKAFDEQLARMSQLFDETSKAQANWHQTLMQSVDDAAALMKSSLRYQTELSAELGKVTLDAVKKTTEMFSR